MERRNHDIGCKPGTAWAVDRRKEASGPAPESIHVFEKAGLGKAPYQFLGVEHRVGPIKIGEENGVETWAGAPGQPMGVCAFCGTGIADCFYLKSADGKRFYVGCDCIGRAGDAGLKKIASREISKKRKQAETARVDMVRAMVASDPAVRAKLSAVPSNVDYRAARGETMLDWAEWMLKHSGHSGCMKVVRYLARLED
jgi:hypothetical protein